MAVTSPERIRRAKSSISHRNSVFSVALGVMLAIHAVLLMWGATRQAPTFNEPAHLVSGVGHLTLGRFELFRVNPPLVRMIAALPVVAMGCNVDWTSFRSAFDARPEFEAGERFVEVNAQHLMWLFTLGRWACIPFSVLGAWTCYRWAADLAGRRSGLLACSLWCACPAVIGHGQLLTPDVPAAAMGILSCFVFWRWLRRPDWGQTLLTGVILGLAQLTKTTLLILYPVWLAVWLAARCRRRSEGGARHSFEEIIKAASLVLISVNIVNLGYGFSGSFLPLRDFDFVSDLFVGRTNSKSGDIQTGSSSSSKGNRFEKTVLGDLPVPLPKDYVLGLDVQQSDFEEFGRPSYLRGEFRDRGWWYYYLYGFAITLPLSFWALAFLSFIVRIKYPSATIPFESEVLLIGVPATILAIASTKCGFTHHMRYVLPCLPFAFCWVAVTLETCATHFDGSRFRSLRRVRSTGVFLTTCFTVSSLMVYPHTLSYFNMLASGPFGGPKHLLGSNVDWGQDLIFFKEKLARLDQQEPVFLGYFGGSSPRLYGLTRVNPIPFGFGRDGRLSPLVAGYYAISVNLLFGDRWPARSTVLGDELLPRELVETLRTMKHCDTAGYSIYVFRVQSEPGLRSSSEIHHAHDYLSK